MAPDPDDDRIREVALQNGAPPDLVREIYKKLGGFTLEERVEALRQVQERLGRDADELGQRIVRDWQCPPGAPKTASHLELLAMNAAHALALMGWSRANMDAPAGLGVAAGKSPKLYSILDIVERRLLTTIGEKQSTETGEFLLAWRAQSYARLEVGHKLAAALCLTDVPEDVEVHAPWPAWSLVIPDGLLGELARVWCVGVQAAFVVMRSGSVFVLSGRDEEQDEPANDALRNLIRGACLALSNPDDFRKEQQRTTSERSSKKNRHGPPALDQARYLLSAPVKVDLREHLHAVLSGRKGASPTVQFLVRGHWRQQAHGPRHSLRKTIWVEPFWKGDEEARILLRQHKVEDS